MHSHNEVGTLQPIKSVLIVLFLFLFCYFGIFVATGTSVGDQPWLGGRAMRSNTFEAWTFVIISQLPSPIG
jgi:hypothetical protein